MFRRGPRLSEIVKAKGEEVKTCAMEMVKSEMATETVGRHLIDRIQESIHKGGSKILIADDHKLIRDLLARHLLDKGYAVVTVKDGLEAADRIATNDIGLLITDLSMPRMDGASLASLVNKADFPILIITALTNDSRLQTLKYTAIAKIKILAKPFSLIDIDAFVEANLPLRAA